MRRCYIIVRQLFYLSDGVHYQVTEDNPIRDVFTNAEAAIYLARSCIKYYIANYNPLLHMEEEHPDSELIYKVGAFDSAGNCMREYGVVKKGMRV